MSVISKSRIDYYYDSHLTEEDLMGYNKFQADLVKYLLKLLEWLFHIEGWYVALDLNVYMTPDPREVPTVPEIAVYKTVVLAENQDDNISSWRIDPPEFPPPAIVLEVASKDTYLKDLVEKPETYARMGVKEYVYFDPRTRRPKDSPKLKVWRMTQGRAVELPADERGRVWSEELQSWLVPEARWLRLSDGNGQMRLTGEEAERAAKEAERELKERAWEALRKLGVDPESLG
ncbi:MAG TPA: Uma2 family endonuclease [Armatimonadota bacterium]|nr:Uma2 family endonuclease [Armatimonadota bacterium]